MAASDPAGVILDAVQRNGVLLVHDQVLPSVTAVVTGGPVAGSWWSHPMANAIYNALGDLEDEVATVKLLAGKNTLVARRLWQQLADLGLGRDQWQVEGLGQEAEALLAEIDAAAVPVVVDRPRHRAAELLERRLLAHTAQVHTDTGRHVKTYQGWRSWSEARGVTPTSDGAGARAVFDDLVAPLAARRRLLPW